MRDVVLRVCEDAVAAVPALDVVGLGRWIERVDAVAAGATVDHVVPTFAGERVVSGTAVEDVVAGPADERVVALPADHVLDLEHVVALAGIPVVRLPVECDRHRGGAARVVRRVRARTALQDVARSAAIQHVVTGAAHQRVGLVAAAQHVVAGAAVDPGVHVSLDDGNVVSVTQVQVNAAHGDEATRLPAHLDRPAHWPLSR